jgi:8-oxo-dGTP pyrophosphatase MutT (NUDIX family)
MQYSITFDYLCPFARNAHEAVIAGLAEGREWDVSFHAYSLAQGRVEEGEASVWEEPEGKSGLLAMQWGIAARDAFPDVFPALHRELFAARHDHGQDIKDEAVLRAAAERAGADADAIAEYVAGGKPLAAIAAEHTEAVERWDVFGVPTFIVDDVATFIRFMSRGELADLDRALELLTWHDMNEFKRTRLPR